MSDTAAEDRTTDQATDAPPSSAAADDAPDATRSPGSGPEDRQPDRDAPRASSAPSPEDRDRSRSRSSSSGSTSRKGKRKRTADDRKGGRGSGPRPSSTTRRSYRQPLTRALGTVGVAVAAADPFSGVTIMAKAEDTARMLDEAAQTNPAIARLIESTITGSTGYGAVALGLAPIVVPILWRFGLVPDVEGVRGLLPPEAVAAGQESGAIGPDGAPRKRDRRKAKADRPAPTDDDRQAAGRVVSDLARKTKGATVAADRAAGA